MAKHEFRVVVDGTDLADEDVARISAAVQKAALAEIAATDMRGDFAAHILAGRTSGIYFASLSPEQINSAGLDFEESS